MNRAIMDALISQNSIITSADAAPLEEICSCPSLAEMLGEIIRKCPLSSLHGKGPQQ